MDKILLVASTSYAGMGPYVSEIVNTFKLNDNVCFLLFEDEKKFYSRNITSEILPRCTIISLKDTKWNKFKAIVKQDGNRILLHILTICHNKNIRIVHFLNGLFCPNAIEELYKKRIKVLNTVHDLHPHESRKAWYKMLRMRILTDRLTQSIELSHYCVTNSKIQYEELSTQYPSKKIYYHSFPSLVSCKVSTGTLVPLELKGLTNYILFFGRIEEYKGLKYLFDAFFYRHELYDKYNLVIAGPGELQNFNGLDTRNGKKVIVINRYIDDEEIKYLYENAACVVYPYISATQSGVFSLAFYFGTPIIASDIPFFREIAKESKCVELFECANYYALYRKIIEVLGKDSTILKVDEKRFYESFFSGNAIREELLGIYNDILESDE